ncbi:RNA-guided endonuclease InsQ/TnpB family protein [Salibacterium aidingense]|uniref:RNA-guided endonuclease InsQ/TnpB family protein n=1 Tax=Salibacterium aidingense TaxID=384933 RepID=UPI00041A781C|nr:RNA-guided endonuclease TnpB family protein [Salibacterium aidingense]
MKKTVRLQIVKPMDEDWEILGRVLHDIRYQTRQVLNKTIQLCWEYSNFSSEYKALHGDYPKNKEILHYTSMHGYAYNQLKEQYYYIQSGNCSQTVKRAVDKWKSDLKEILRGDRSIPSYKKDIPIDIVKDAVSLEHDEKNGNYIATLSLMSTAYRKEMERKSGQFRVLLHSGDNSKKTILKRLVQGEYQHTASQIVKKGKKWFLNLSYKFDVLQTPFQTERVMGVDMGVIYPIYMAFNYHDHLRYKIQGGEIERFRRQVESRKKALQDQGKYAGSGRVGHGTKTRIDPLEVIRDKIANFRETKNHHYSRYVVDMAEKHECATIQLEELKGIHQDDAFLKRWSYHDLQEKITYKAEEKGIQVIKVDPQKTSQRCHHCGNIDSNNRKEQASFLCTSCGMETNADFNAAKNISIPGIEQIIQTEMKS